MNTQEARYSLLLNSDDYIFVLDPQLIRRSVNDAYCHFLGRTRDELNDSIFTDYIPEERGKQVTQLVRSITYEQPCVCSSHLSGIPGREEWVSWKATGIYDDDRNLAEIFIVGRNVNDVMAEKRKKEQALVTLSAFRTAVEANISCSITDPHGIITYANGHFCRISKYSRRELQGHPHNQINSGYHPDSFFAHMWQTISTGRMWAGEIKNKAKDGTFFWVNSVIIPIKDASRNISGYLSLHIPIDEKKKMEEDRKVYQQSLENMLHMVSHEIRRPITNCQGLLNILEDPELPDPARGQLLTDLQYCITELNGYSLNLNEYLEHNIKYVSPGS